MVTVPVSFQFNILIKDGIEKNTKVVHGIFNKEGERQDSNKSRKKRKKRKRGKDETEWLKTASGHRAEQKIFDKLQEQFSDRPCLLVNGFKEDYMIKVAKEKIPKKKKGKLSDQVKIS